MAKPNPFESARTFVVKGGMPITTATIAVAALAFLAWWFAKLDASWYPLAFDSTDWWLRPWSVVTYAFLESSSYGILFSGLMAFFFMGALERAWSRARFVPAYIALLLVPPLALWLGAVASGVEQTWFGMGLTTACWLVAFATFRPRATIMVMCVLPVKAFWLGWIAALGIVFTVGSGAPIAGLCAGLAPLTAWALAKRRLEMGVLHRKKPSFRDEFGKSLKTKRDSEMERLRLRQLLERSVKDEDQPKG